MSLELKDQAGKLLGHVAGHVGLRTIEMGLTHGLFEEIRRHEDGIPPASLAEKTGLDPFYVRVWAQSAFAAEVLELDGDDRLLLAPHMEDLLLNEDFPGYLGAVFNILLQPELYDRFSENFASGRRIWWDECSPDFIHAVSRTGRSFYTRMIPAGFERVPGLKEKLENGASLLELCCGAGRGLARLAEHYPTCRLSGLDGDAYSLELTEQLLKASNGDSKVSLIHCALEDIRMESEYDVVFINISMHECRDIDEVARNVHRSLRAGGMFVISDFPFAERTSDCRTVPNRIMCGIQFFEALIDDQLLPTRAFIDLLNRHGFKDVDSTELTPVHAVTWGHR
jgi:SAM-dependent methyltransferase